MSIRSRSVIAPAAALLLACAALAAASIAAAPAHAGPRLDRTEREELRYELRRQSREDRDEQARGRRALDPSEFRGAPGSRRGWDGDRPPDRRGAWDTPDSSGRQEGHRMAPEEREQLRRMLRDHRRGRRD